MSNILDFSIPIVITIKGSQEEPHTCHVVSFTDQSLTVNSKKQLAEDCKVYLHLLRELIPFVVTSTDEHPQEKDSFRIKLESSNSDIKLSSYFSSFAKFAS